MHAIKSVLATLAGNGNHGEALSQEVTQGKISGDQNADTVAALVNFAPNGANTCKWTYVLE